VVADVVLPQMGLEVSEGTVTAVLVAPGDSVAEGETVVEVETDKAIAEVAAPRAGVVTTIVVAVGETIPVGATLVRIGDSADDVEEAEGVADAASADAMLDSEAAADFEAATEVAAAPGSRDRADGRIADTSPVPASANGSERRRAAPIARRAASEFGLSLDRIEGTGPGGRITLGDVERAAAEDSGSAASRAPAASAPSPGGAPSSSSGERLEPLSATRQAIARRLAESQLVPQYTLTRDVDATWLMSEKARLSAEGPTKVGVVDLLVQALAEALVRHPRLAASFVPAANGEPAMYRHRDGVDVGIAVATERGLLVPVLRRAGERTLPELVLERARLVDLTRAGRLGLGDMGDAAATLSSLGTFGVDSFTAMLNPGESAILAVGRTVERVVPRDRGLAVVPTLTMTLTLDHRVVDGATGAAALAELAELLEGGMAWRT
jgi:pyruvate dehydrogenase E2 component (dihydrolipoamide acetyltransferase)